MGQRRMVAARFQWAIKDHVYLGRKRSRHFHSTTPILGTNSGNVNDDNDDPLTNGGTVVGVYIFHRHGDRAPNRYLGKPDNLQGESEHWYSRIPSCFSGRKPPGGEAHVNLSRYFPPEIHASQNGGNYLDVNREPFGFLTYRGMDQMRDVGNKFRRRYERFGHRVDALGGNSIDGAYSFLDHWNVQAYSTNYLRTVMSVQCFLDGLIGKSPSENDQQNQIYAGGGLNQFYKDQGKYEQLAHLEMSTWTTAEDMRRKGGSSSMEGYDDYGIKVQVRDKEIDTLNAFDRYPQMMNGLVKDVIATERFQRIDGAAKPLADELSTYLPGLRGAPQAFGGTPSGINWIHANDHFVCRRAHSIPLAADFSDNEAVEQRLEDREDAEATLASLGKPVCSHLAWRFREWYRSPKLLSSVACPPFREILNNMREASSTRGPQDRKPFVLYSCHDVTLLALLYAIGADFLCAGEDCGGENMREEGAEDDGGTYSGMTNGSVRKGVQQSSWRWWPAYSSTIAFELVRLDKGEHNQEHVIRIILNGDAMKLIPRMSIEDEGLLKEQPLSSRQVFGDMTIDGESRMMSLSDFEQVISVLEEAGGSLDRSSSLIADETNMNSIGKIGVDGG